MAAQDTKKRGQVCDMKPTAETIPNASVPPAGAILEADLQAHIGRQLRAVYDEVVNEGVPDRFVRLLEELERKKTEGEGV
jgi:Anti-sigma factor NepR